MTVNYMDISLQSIGLFVVATILYFVLPMVGKPKLSLDDLSIMNEYNGRVQYSLVLFLVLVVTTQMMLNIAYLAAKCGGSIESNIGIASFYTIIPWVFIFGAVLITINVFPNLKSAFSDVVGYFVVASQSNELLSQLLGANEIPTNNNAELTKTSQTIAKILGNKSIVINQITPYNFTEMWNTLSPIMKSPDDLNMKQQLLDIVVRRDDIGEAMWYIYTAILISSIVYYNLATRGCTKSSTDIKNAQLEYQQMKEKEQL